MGIRDHLIRKPTVDVNGKQTTVFVKPAEQSFNRNRVASIDPRASTAYLDTMAPTPIHRVQMALICEADYPLREKMAADENRVPAALEILGSDLDPLVRNLVSGNSTANSKALANIVTQESNPFGSEEDFDDEYQKDTLLNVALHANTDYDTLAAISRIRDNNDEGSAVALQRMNGSYATDPRLAYAS